MNAQQSVFYAHIFNGKSIVNMSILERFFLVTSTNILFLSAVSKKNAFFPLKKKSVYVKIKKLYKKAGGRL